MSRSLSTILACFILSALSFRVLAQAPAVTASPVVQPEKSDSLLQLGVRDPFWPVGYTPKVARKSVETSAGNVTSAGPVSVVPDLPLMLHWDEARHNLDIRGISLIGYDKGTGKPKYLALVSGKLIEEGDIMSVTYKARLYRWKVVAIGAGGVSFQKLDVR